MSETTVAVQRAKEPTAVQVPVSKAFDQMNAIFENIARRAFEIFEGNGRVFGRDVEDWFQAERELLRPVNVELTETEAAFELKAEAPGFNEKELEVNVEPRRVLITGKRETKAEETKGKVVRSEASAEQMLRVVELPAEVDAAKAAATLMKNGILSVTMPKAAKAQPVGKPAAA